jgi:hypothetical protein
MLRMIAWFQVFSYVFTSVSYACFKCFICLYVASVFIWMLYLTYMLQVFYLDVVYDCNGFKFFHMFLQVFHTHVSSVSSVFKHILQVLHLDV